MRSRSAFMAGLFMCLVLGACSRSPAPPDPEASTRIAALSPAIAVILRDLGAGDRIVARHGYDSFTDPSIPTAGDQGGIDYEALLRRRPTHVLLEWGARPLPDRLNELAASHGWHVESFRLLSTDDIRDATLRLGGLLGDEATAAATALVAALDAALTPDAVTAARAGRCLPLFSVSPPAAAGPGSIHHEVLERMGIQPALSSGGPFIELDREGVRRLAPDSIVVLAPGATQEQTEDMRRTIASWGLPPGLAGRIVFITDPLCQTPTPRLADIPIRIREAMAAWATPGAQGVALPK